VRITVNYPNRPFGAPVEIMHLGLFENGSEHELDASTVESYEDRGYNLPEGGVFGEPLAQPKSKKSTTKTEVTE